MMYREQNNKRNKTTWWDRFSISWALLWQNFAHLLWEEVRALTDLRHDSQKFQRRTHECEFSCQAVSSFYIPQ